MILRNEFRYMSVQDLKWAKALVAAIVQARGVGGFKEDPALGAYKVPGYSDYVVVATNDIATNMAWGAFVMALIRSPDYDGHGEVLSELPRGSRCVFPPSRRTPAKHRVIGRKRRSC